MDLQTAPDYAAPFVGWRTWALTRSDGELRLRSVLKPTVWEPCEPLRARCLRSRVSRLVNRHAAPVETCVCGVYAAELRTAAAYLGDPLLGAMSLEVRHVVGRVALWGDVIECDRGYRASLAYPQHVYVAARALNGERRHDADDVATALEHYRVPVTIVDLDEPRLLRALARSSGPPSQPAWFAGA